MTSLQLTSDEKKFIELFQANYRAGTDREISKDAIAEVFKLIVATLVIPLVSTSQKEVSIPFIGKLFSDGHIETSPVLNNLLSSSERLDEVEDVLISQIRADLISQLGY